jgi:hypothetical protein
MLILMIMGKELNNNFKGKGEKRMNVIDYVKSCILEKDRENLLKTKSIAKRHLDFGHPLVPKFEEKIDEFGVKYRMSRGQILASIVSDDVAATRFAKSASRQRMAEKSQLEYLKSIRRVKIDRLKQSGPESIRIRNGELEYGIPKTVDSTKAIDAFSGNTDFVFLKWTDGYGGGQDNQAMDAVRFLEAAHEYTSKHDDKYRFVAILDGPYFKRHWSVFTDFRTDRVSAVITPVKKEYQFEIKTN